MIRALALNPYRLEPIHDNRNRNQQDDRKYWRNIEPTHRWNQAPDGSQNRLGQCRDYCRCRIVATRRNPAQDDANENSVNE